MNKVTITYRSHSADDLLRGFADNHEEVELIVFPQDWTPEQCQDEVMCLKPWENGKWFYDRTSYPEEIREGLKLDSVIAKAVEKAASQGDTESVWIKVLDSLENGFDRVVLYTARLTDHAPFRDMENPADTFVGWLKKAGFRDVSVRSDSPFRQNVDVEEASDLLADVDRPNTLLLADRHDMTIRETELNGGGTLLHVPLLNLLIEGLDHMESFSMGGIQKHLKTIASQRGPVPR